MRNSIVLFICVISLSIFAQKPVANTGNRSQLMKIWVMEDGFFPSEKVRFRIYDAAKDSVGFYTSYEFKTGGEIGYEFHTPRGVGVCGNGLQMIQKTKWSVKGNTLRVYIKGRYLAEGTFEWDVLYEIEKVTADQLILKRKKVFKNNRCETCND